MADVIQFWESPDGNTKNEIDYIMTDKPSMVTDVTVINRVNIGSDHRIMACRFHIYSLNCRYLQLICRYLQMNCRYLQIGIFVDISN